jgi:hypothetical protein
MCRRKEKKKYKNREEEPLKRGGRELEEGQKFPSEFTAVVDFLIIIR